MPVPAAHGPWRLVAAKRRGLSRGRASQSWWIATTGVVAVPLVAVVVVVVGMVE